MKRAGGLALVFVPMLGLLACNAILGIEEATVDPSLEPGGAVGGGDSGADGGAEGDAVADGAPEVAPSDECTEYCDKIEAACTGADKQYLSRVACEAFCAAFIPGQGPSGDTLACRLAAVRSAAVGELDSDNCLGGGPFGGAKCLGPEEPSGCSAFCRLVDQLCAPLAIYEGGGCFDTCRNYDFRNGGRLFDVNGEMLDQNQDSLDCRMTHLQIARSDGIDDTRLAHCPHTGLVSATCVEGVVADAGVADAEPGGGGG